MDHVSSIANSQSISGALGGTVAVIAAGFFYLVYHENQRNKLESDQNRNNLMRWEERLITQKKEMRMEKNNLRELLRRMHEAESTSRQFAHELNVIKERNIDEKLELRELKEENSRLNREIADLKTQLREMQFENRRLMENVTLVGPSRRFGSAGFALVPQQPPALDYTGFRNSS